MIQCLLKHLFDDHNVVTLLVGKDSRNRTKGGGGHGTSLRGGGGHGTSLRGEEGLGTSLRGEGDMVLH